MLIMAVPTPCEVRLRLTIPVFASQVPAGFPSLAGLDVRHAAVVLDLGLNVFHVTPPCGALLY